MKISLFVTFCLLGVNLLAQERSTELHVGAGAGISAGNNLFGQRFKLLGQFGRKNLTVYHSYAQDFVGFDHRTEVMLANRQIGALIGYDLLKTNEITLMVQTGLCYGSTQWKSNQKEFYTYFNGSGLVEASRPLKEQYNYLGLPMALDVHVVLNPFLGLNFYATGTIQRHPDYSFGTGLIMGYFGRTNRSKPE